MIKRPKRRKDLYNPYNIETDNKNYTVSFIDSNKVFQVVHINKEIYDLLNSFELEDISQMNKFDRHIEHSEVYEETLHKRAIRDTFSFEDEIIQKTEFEELRKAINKLPQNQQRRIKMYYFDELTQQEIAEKDGVDIRAVQYTLHIALKNLKKFLK